MHKKALSYETLPAMGSLWLGQEEGVSISLCICVDSSDTLLIHLEPMPTTKTRLNISLSPDVERALVLLARRDRVPHATKAAELLRRALEIEEDVRLDVVAGVRDRKGVRHLSHAKTWQ